MTSITWQRQFTATKIGTSIMAVVMLAGILGLTADYYAVGIDWKVFHAATLTSPYSTTNDYVTPPWTPLLLPHKLLPLKLSNAVNLFINLAVLLLAIKVLGGGWKAALIIFTNPVLYAAMCLNNVDWLPLLGLLAGPWVGPILLSCKPHVLGGAMLIWMRKDWRVILVPLVLLLISFAAWGWWPGQITHNPINKAYNLAPFPAGVPVGAYLLWKAYKQRDVYLAAVSTSLFSPYISSPSLLTVLVVVSSRWPKAGAWMSFVIWAFFTITIRKQLLYG